MFNNILVAIDESEVSNKVLEAARSMVDINRSNVTIVLVNVSKENVTPGLTYVPKDYLEDVLLELENESKDILEKAKNKLMTLEGATVNTVSLKGDPAHQILEYAKEHAQDMIIIGSRGISGVKGVMLGSVSHKVSQLSECPVLIVH
ncbi:universal stress protein [Oceanobacillus timonensis]|uniref:universal stress protein n=1 Tax=Oceanobacillus timonensis TaxID=1926285 RepID=UPI0009B97720|nr:universal stress protein [Oceanobacillus timonensis]